MKKRDAHMNSAERHLLREQRRKEEHKNGSEDGSSIGWNRSAIPTILCPSAATGYDHDEQSGKGPVDEETPHQESTRRDLTEVPDATNYARGISRRTFGVDRAAAQLHEPSEENASRSRRQQDERR
uniref:Uncharacterized protein n=1 Tax=Parascaris univalens TaxID=6257 RepID=A0A915A3Q4_PARUN